MAGLTSVRDKRATIGSPSSGYLSTALQAEANAKLTSEIVAQTQCHEQIAASLEVLKTQLAEAV
jgi:hypothetical protein